ncbi:hypothetical protein EC973_003441 [Apophysomyces ossiformis]|uniref:BHLH domain-containing protein n=1 Tax=Apophysomyces ossiformis TaxID=679940 RepID=A0A8H7BRC6_9FUNG|nr:hypothetical protein EC973_003441 [Apophysomyces ossiformis]
MPSEKISHSARSARQAATQNFLGISFSSTMLPLEESDLAHVDKRTAHNALERQRREGLNNKFQQLAHALPSLQTVCRPSKTMIVTKSLEFVSDAIQRELRYQKKIKLLCEENERLLRKARKSSLQMKKKASAERATPASPAIHGNLSPPPSPVESVAKTKGQSEQKGTTTETTPSPVAYSQTLTPAVISPAPPLPPSSLPDSSVTVVESLASPMGSCGTPNELQAFSSEAMPGGFYYPAHVTEPLLTQETSSAMSAYYFYEHPLVTASPSTVTMASNFQSFLPTTFVSPYMPNNGKLKVVPDLQCLLSNHSFFSRFLVLLRRTPTQPKPTLDP